MKKILPALVFCLSTGLACAAEVNPGVAAYTAGDFAKAQEAFKASAAKGDATALYYVGRMQMFGEGVAKDEKAGAALWEKAAAKGNTDAQKGLGVCYSVGRGVKQDFKTSAKWYGKAAEAGHVGAQHDLANLYATGSGVNKDLTTAYQWESLAAEAGMAPAVEGLSKLTAQMKPEEVEAGKKAAAAWKTRHPAKPAAKAASK